MIRYEDILKQISILEKRKSRNEEKMDQLSKDNTTIQSNLKVFCQRKESFEKMNQELSKLISKKSKSISTSASTDLARTE